MTKEDLRDIMKKLDGIKDDTNKIKVEQAVQGKDIAQNAKDLEEHMRRTIAAEEAIAANKNEIVELQQRTAWTWLKENAKTLAIVLGIAGTIIGLLEWALIHFNH